MRKRARWFVVAILVGLLLLGATPVAAGPPSHVEGLWQYLPTIESSRTAGCNTFLTTTEVGLWTGDIVGNSTEAGKVTIHCSGAWSFNAIVSFSDVTVDGRSGTLEMSVVGTRPDGAADWEGKWIILSGTGDVKALRGQGTWWGPGAAGPGSWGDIFYAGNVHFEPR